MTLTAKQIRNLHALLCSETLSWSALNDNLRQLLIDEQLLIIKTHRSHKSIYSPNPNGLKVFLEQHFEELRGFHWEEDFPTVSFRSELAAESGNSKTKAIRSCTGFMVNSYEPIPAKMGDQDLIIAPAEGTMLFVSDWGNFSIKENTLVIGIENMENFRRIREQKYLFQSLNPILFVARYPQSTDLRQWLMKIPNKYIHFGDFDLAGIHIYESEIYKYLRERASFFIPNDIEMRISHGSTERYDSQYSKFKDYKPSDSRLTHLFELIHRYHRCYDQEGYISR